MQAPVAPVDVDGVAAAQVGTVVFMVLAAACLWFRAELAAMGNLWWLWTCVTGAGLGLAMTWFTRSRRSRARLRAQHGGAQSNSAASTEIESQTGSGR